MTPNITEKLALEGFLGQQAKVFLANRNIALRGQLVGHDGDTVVLQDEYGRTVVYKSQIISITGDVDE